VQSRAKQLLANVANHEEAGESLRKLAEGVHAIFAGSRDPALADDPALAFQDTAELLFLLERLQLGE